MDLVDSNAISNSVGFFTGSYLLFVSSIVLPALGYVYWHDATESSHETAFNNATIAGCMVGMGLFGVLADIFGRRKVYGFEIVVLMIGTMGVVMSSTGYLLLDQVDGRNIESLDYGSFGSMNIQTWLLFWRAISGIGIGGEYPLSAVIASEYAPTSKRPRLLAIVFAMQAFGITSGAIVSIIVTEIVRKRHPYDPEHPEASARAVDQIWRWVIGSALFPALVTAIMRFTVPESPRYTLDVKDDPLKASEETGRLKGFHPQGGAPNESNEAVVKENANPDGGTNAENLHDFEEHEEETDLKAAIKHYFWTEGNWRYLFATSLSWFVVDFSTFSLDIKEAQTLSKFWYGPTILVKDPETWDSNTVDLNASIFDVVIQNCFHISVIQSVPTITGSILFILFITRVNRKMLTWVMFLVTGTLLVITGVTLLETVGTQSWGTAIAIYAFTKFSNAFGVGPLTFMLPAELFPTRFRASCHGISASFGKFGSVLASVFLSYITFGEGTNKVTATNAPLKWMSYVLMIFAAPIFLGAFITWQWIPELQEPSGKNKTLEQLAETSALRRNETDALTDDP